MTLSTPRRGLTIRSEVLPEVNGAPLLEPLKLEGEEGVNQLFEYRLVLQSAQGGGASLDLNSFIGRELTCCIELEGQGSFEPGVPGGSLAHQGAGVREISGLITEARYLGESGRHALVEFTLKPWLHLATLTTDCKVFQDQSAVQIIESVLGEYGQKNQNSSCWVRVSSEWAGNQLGAMHLPRVGQEVIVSFLGGDPEQPIVTGRVHNQANQPPWSLPGQQALSGFRSRELTPGGGNAAGGRSNHLILDDTEQKIQAQLKSDHQHSQLGLGHLTRIEDHQGRKDERGEGFELRTDGHGAIRAKEGLLISTEGRENARAHAKDMGETASRLSEGQSQHEGLGELAQQHRAQEGGAADQAEVAQSLKAQNEAIAGTGTENPFPELSEPHLVLASPVGIESTTAGSTHQHSGQHHAITAQGHASVSAGKSWLVPVGTRPEVARAIKSIYDGLPTRWLKLEGPARGAEPAYTLAVEFMDSENPRENIHHYQLLADGLSRGNGDLVLEAAGLTARVRARAGW